MQSNLEKLRIQLDSVLREQQRLTKAVEVLNRKLSALEKEEKQVEPKDLVVEERKDRPIVKEKTEEPVHKVDYTLRSGVAVSDDYEEKPSEHFEEQESGFDWEEFVGTNLMTKLAVLIIVIGLAYGINYALEHDWLSPTMRIIGGLIVALGMIGVAFKFREKYEQWSGVVLAGGIAASYVLSYLAYDTYHLIPNLMAFALMLLYTAFAVVSSIRFNRQFIAVFGLVGAYAIPFLLSTGSGRVDILFTYLLLVNSGITIVSFKQNWRILEWLSLVFTWLIFASWLVLSYDDKYNTFAQVINVLFFLQFFVIGLGRRVMKRATLTMGEVLRILINALISFLLGLSLLNHADVSDIVFGFYALLYASVNFGALALLKRKELLGETSFYLVAAMAFTFLAIVFPLSMDGEWVTLFWFAEGLLLYLFGVKKKVAVLEILGIPFFILGMIGLFHDWSGLMSFYMDAHSIILNPTFIVGVVVGLASIWVYLKTANEDNELMPANRRGISDTFKKIILPVSALVIVLGAGHMEIQTSFYWIYLESKAMVFNEYYQEQHESYDMSWRRWANLWSVVYAIGVFIVLNLSKRLKAVDSKNMILINLSSILLIVVSLVVGLYELSELRESYLRPDSDVFVVGQASWLMRYLVIAAVGWLILILYRRFLANPSADQWIKSLFYIPIVWVASSELIHWLDIMGSANNYRMGLSILWSVIAMIMVYRGVVTKERITRISGIVFFLITLIKIGLYDFSHMTGGTKAIVLISLGFALLASSYFYFRFKAKHDEPTE